MVDVIRELWIKELETSKAIIPNSAPVGTGLVPHAEHIIKTIEQQACTSVLCIGRGALRTAPLALLQPVPPNVTWHGAKMPLYVIPPGTLMDAPRKAFDMVIVCRWAGTIALEEQARLAGILRGLTVKVLYVIEALREHKPAEPGIMQRPDGWDRMDWSFHLGLAGGPKVRLVTHDMLPDGSAMISRLKTDDGRLWMRDV